ncbi:MAG: class I SAM-dependent methyltransferase [Micromonosporaceae bacterium]|nr:class I SAM-dependent methyltransferase [Micromonosporaceae bacterium]
MTLLNGQDERWTGRQDQQAAAFDRIGDRYDEAFPHRDGQLRTCDLLLKRLPAEAHVLDVGCGTGLPTARRLVDGGCRVTGIDISPVMIELARHNVPDATFVHQDVTALEPGWGTFDAIVAFFSLLMLPKPVIVDTLNTLRQLLRPQGCLALGMVDADLDDVTIPFLGHPVRVSAWPVGQLQKVLRGAGFEIVSQAIRTYAPATEETPPEVQIYLLATAKPA